MGLFDKKYCDVCGEKIGLLGNRKLEDGNLCKNCAGKLSPFFSERRRSTVEEIREQLAYREANQELVAAFNPTKVLGGDMKIYFDGQEAVAGQPRAFLAQRQSGCFVLFPGDWLRRGRGRKQTGTYAKGFRRKGSQFCSAAL